jgi:hypothetical protein
VGLSGRRSLPIQKSFRFSRPRRSCPAASLLSICGIPPHESTPEQAAAKVVGVEPVDEEAKARFSNLVHWGCGTAWGGARGLLAAAGLSGSAASAAHLGVVWGSEQVMLPVLGVTPPLTEWGAKELAIDALHHLVYAGATGVAYSLIDR